MCRRVYSHILCTYSVPIVRCAHPKNKKQSFIEHVVVVVFSFRRSDLKSNNGQFNIKMSKYFFLLFLFFLSFVSIDYLLSNDCLSPNCNAIDLFASYYSIDPVISSRAQPYRYSFSYIGFALFSYLSNEKKKRKKKNDILIPEHCEHCDLVEII